MWLLKILIMVFGERTCCNCQQFERRTDMDATMAYPAMQSFCKIDKPLWIKCKYHKFKWYVIEFEQESEGK